MKKTLAALTLALALLTVPAAAFSDVDSGLYYAAPIAWAVEKGITTGTTESTFSPDALCTRGQIITFLWRAAGSPAPGSKTVQPFTDVAESAHYYQPVLWALAQEILDGRETLRPDTPCTRGETMLYLWRYAGSPAAGAPAAFTDVAPDADYAQAVAWAVSVGITDGTADATFSPDEVCTRGQIATFLYRCLNDAAPAPEPPAEPETPPAPRVPEEKTEEVHPLRTLTGEGRAFSMGLDGSDFTSDGVYDAKVTVDIYSPYEAVFTVQVPFPLYQACNYTVRFEDPEKSGSGYLFTCLRWDEAFADMLPWEGEHHQYRFTNMTGNAQNAVLVTAQEEEDRMGGSISWRMGFISNSDFNYSRLDDYELSCEVSSNM